MLVPMAPNERWSLDFVSDHCLQVGEGTVCDGKSKPTSRDRIVAQCFLDKLDVAEEMAKSGTACDWPKFSGGHYKISDATCSRK